MQRPSIFSEHKKTIIYLNMHLEENTLWQERLLSLDFFRGLTMFLLISEITFYKLLSDPTIEGSIVFNFIKLFQHQQWEGLRPWDLVQPFFMFIVGVAMPFSYAKRWERGDSWTQTLKHAIWRSLVLLFLGWALYCIRPGKITFEFWNVLAQLSVTYLIAFLMMRKPMQTQLIFTIGLLVFTELLYRYWPVQGFNQPFVPDKNFGAWFDMLIMGKLSDGHWVAFNAVPTTAHTMWGVLAGLIIKSERVDLQKIKTLFIAGIIGVVIGVALNPITPIIKRIATGSFVIVSGGCCLIALALFYWLVEVKKIQKVPIFFAIVGMNPIFIYLFSQTGGTEWLEHIVSPFTEGLFSFIGEMAPQFITACIVLFIQWYICYWLYKKKLFIKI